MESLKPSQIVQEDYPEANAVKEISESFPRSKGFGIRSNKLYEYQGFWYEARYLERVISVHRNFNPKPTDIILCSFPKSGTTWLKALAYSVAAQTQFNDNYYSKSSSASPLLTKLPHDFIPFIENKPENKHFPITGTHIPSNSLPKSVIDSGCKIVYVCRDPKDVFVSMWQFSNNLLLDGEERLSLEEAFELFCNGISYCGPVWEHNLGYWRASLEQPERVLFLKYEEIKKDPEFHVKRLAEFMGHPFSAEEEQNGVVRDIINMCSFDNLRNLEVNKNGKSFAGTPFEFQNSHVFSKR